MQGQADFEQAHGLRPSLSISRRGMKHGPRSTLGTMTGIYDLYRLLFSRIGKSDLTKEVAFFFTFFPSTTNKGLVKAAMALGKSQFAIRKN